MSENSELVRLAATHADDDELPSVESVDQMLAATRELPASSYRDDTVNELLDFRADLLAFHEGRLEIAEPEQPTDVQAAA